MVELYGRIDYITGRVIKITVFRKNEYENKLYWNNYQLTCQNLEHKLSNKISIKYDKTNIDKFIESLNWICWLAISNGVLVDCEKLYYYDDLVQEAYNADKIKRW